MSTSNQFYQTTTVELSAFDRAETTADTTTLAEAVRSTFMLSMDARLSLGQRSVLNVLGGRLRDQLRDLLGQIFDAGTAVLSTANRQIREVNTELTAAKADIDKVADTIESIGKLAASLDKLISLVGAAV
jgi:peptidoglycan hydrolase CwlO-like protein